MIFAMFPAALRCAFKYNLQDTPHADSDRRYDDIAGKRIDVDGTGNLWSMRF